MRIITRSLADFLTNATLEGRELFQNAVYFQRHEISANSDPVRTSSSKIVILQLYAVIYFEDTSQALLECAEECGFDRTTDGGSFEGSLVFDDLVEELTQTAAKRGWNVLPGVIDY